MHGSLHVTIGLPAIVMSLISNPGYRQKVHCSIVMADAPQYEV
jgi:hypothetical protein